MKINIILSSFYYRNATLLLGFWWNNFLLLESTTWWEKMSHHRVASAGQRQSATAKPLALVGLGGSNPIRARHTMILRERDCSDLIYKRPDKEWYIYRGSDASIWQGSCPFADLQRDRQHHIAEYGLAQTLETATDKVHLDPDSRFKRMYLSSISTHGTSIQAFQFLRQDDE